MNKWKPKMHVLSYKQELLWQITFEYLKNYLVFSIFVGYQENN